MMKRWQDVERGDIVRIPNGMLVRVDDVIFREGNVAQFVDLLLNNGGDIRGSVDSEIEVVGSYEEKGRSNGGL